MLDGVCSGVGVIEAKENDEDEDDRSERTIILPQASQAAMRRDGWTWKCILATKISIVRVDGAMELPDKLIPARCHRRKGAECINNYMPW
jgi:hypothetical protein